MHTAEIIANITVAVFTVTLVNLSYRVVYHCTLCILL